MWFHGLIEGVDGNGGDSVFPEKLKRERMRKLSVVGKIGSDSGDELRSTVSISKRFKLPREAICNYVLIRVFGIFFL